MSQTDPEVIRRLTTAEQAVEDLVMPEITVDLISPFLQLPGLRGFWPMSAVAYTNPQALDVSGNGNHLTRNSAVTFGYDGLVPYAEFNAVPRWLVRPDGGVGNWADILGNEPYIVAGDRGLTVGGWFKADRYDAVNFQVLMAHGQGAFANHSFWIFFGNAGAPYFNRVGLQVGGVAAFTTVISTETYVSNVWQFVVGRFVPSTSVDIYLNDGKTIQAVAVPATIPDSTSDFYIGDGGWGPNLHGRASMCFLCATALSDAIISALRESTKAAYGVD